ncbi:MAG: TlpA family protein disulfide reductase [Elusimicrobia bacterium]|nr:TlpA family protein disulfide reductase [Elusimicrobiota bacterium]
MRMRIWKLLWPLRAWRRKGLEEGDYFPGFTLSDAAGRRFSLSENPEGKMTALWLTNLCEDCRSKVPLLEELRREAGDRFRILAISLLGDDRTLPAQVSARCGFPILLDPEDIVARKLGLAHPPRTCPLHNLFILDRDRRIVFRHHLSALKPEAFRTLWRGLAPPA